MHVWLLAFLAAVGVGLTFYGLNAVLGGQRMASRLEQFAMRDRLGGEEPKPRETAGLTGSLQRAMGQKRTGKIARDLARADIRLTTAEFFVIKFACVIGLFVVGFVLMRGNGLMTLLVAGIFALLGYHIPDWWVKIKLGRRLKEFNSQLADAISMLANSLRSGYSLLQSMEMVAREAPTPMSDEFRRVVREVGLGLSSQEALVNLLRRVPSDDLDLLVTAVSIQHEVGGNLAQILDSIGVTIRERVRIKGEIKTLTSQQVLSGYMITALPVGIGLFIYVINSAYMKPLFQFPWLALPGCAAVMMVVGFFLIRKIVNIRV